MALAAGLRFARLRLGEAMASVASTATTGAAVRIDAADTSVRPCGGIELATGQHLDGRAVALEAADRDRGRTADHFPEEIVERGENFAGLGVMAALLLVDLLLMAARAILRRHDHRDKSTVVLERVGIAFFGAVAVVAIDTLLPVRAGAPLLRQGRIHRLMALQALGTFGRAPCGARRGGFRLLLVWGHCSRFCPARPKR